LTQLKKVKTFGPIRYMHYRGLSSTANKKQFNTTRIILAGLSV